MKRKILAALSIIYIYIYIYTAATPTAWALQDSTSFNPEQVQVQAQSIGVPVGTVIVWTKEIIPDGWLECDGQKVNAVLYPELADLMPNTPNYKGRFLQGTNTNTKVGDKIEAGLPNITGYLNNMLGSGAVGSTWSNGAFKVGRQAYWVKFGDDDGCAWGVTFNAAYSNSIYGRSTTVQPPAVTVKYIIKAE